MFCIQIDVIYNADETDLLRKNADKNRFFISGFLYVLCSDWCYL